MSRGLDAGRSILETPRDLPGRSAHTPLEASAVINQSPGTCWTHYDGPDMFAHRIERIVVKPSMCSGDVTQAPSAQHGLQNHNTMERPLGRRSLESPFHLAKLIETFPYVCVHVWTHTCAHVCGSHGWCQPSFWLTTSCI